MRRMKIRIVPHRRRREQKTDYKLRLRLLKSGKPRFVVRASGRSVTCQIVLHDSKGDRTIANATALELKKHGWKGHTGNLPAAYLTGYLCGQKAKGKVREAVLDIGLHTSVKGARIYAALKGVLDAGIEIPHSEEVLPSEERIKGAHIYGYAELLKKEKPQEYEKRFSGYLKGSLAPEDLAKHFEEVKAKLGK
ncbi:MAG TPA: 50S ribosomal protein L18 [archaeon]|nr:50S ribosomal protein L18 [archaeon]